MGGKNKIYKKKCFVNFGIIKNYLNYRKLYTLEEKTSGLGDVRFA